MYCLATSWVHISAFKCCRQGSGFNGNASMRLINPENLDKLLLVIPQEFDMYVSALRAFGRVVKSCFGLKLSSSYISDIEHFKKCYLNLGISVTPKVTFISWTYVQELEDMSLIFPFLGSHYVHLYFSVHWGSSCSWWWCPKGPWLVLWTSLWIWLSILEKWHLYLHDCS